VIEYLLANGTERVVDEIIDNSSQIAVCAISLFNSNFTAYNT
jgi:hypothetical protein